VPTVLPPSLNFLIPYQCDLERVGNTKDGGYVLPSRVIRQTSHLLSIGISTDWSLEQALCRCNKGMRIYAFDRSSGSLVFLYFAIRNLLRGRQRGASRIGLMTRLGKAIYWVKLSARFRWFFKGKRKFIRRWVKQSASSRKEVSLSMAVSLIPRIGSIVLKIDIEGDEYKLFDQLRSALTDRQDQVSAICVEFHETERNRAEFVQIVTMIGALFPVAHIHGNNYCPLGSDGLPTVLEITFVSHDLVRNSRVFKFPRPGLDFPNNPEVPDLSINFERLMVG
jgi:hypothetical protein